MGIASDGNAGQSGHRGRKGGSESKGRTRGTRRKGEKINMHKEHADRSYLRPQQAHGEIGSRGNRNNISYSEVAADVEKRELRDVPAQRDCECERRVTDTITLFGKGTEDKLCTGVAVTGTAEGVRARRAIMEIRSLYPTVFWEKTRGRGVEETTKTTRRGAHRTKQTKAQQHRGLNAKKQSGSAERAPKKKKRGTWVKGLTGGAKG
ncbi:hypothetical protein ERJ75_001633500 [Trypanosoma vivax]|nr:hypothetical protein ERJ75_001634400 [Trypanosoma vivax]KAH8605274.1 hypothetical protein ERJ75_001633500 [Trypanosoma vivax]